MNLFSQFILCFFCGFLVSFDQSLIAELLFHQHGQVVLTLCKFNLTLLSLFLKKLYNLNDVRLSLIHTMSLAKVNSFVFSFL